MVACFSQAQNKKFIPLLGSTQDISKSEFCKIYKCKAVYDKEKGFLTHYILNLPGDNPAFFKTTGRTEMSIKYDSKKQIIFFEFRLQEDSRNNRIIANNESKMLADAMRYFVGKMLPLDKNYKGDHSSDVDECFAGFKEAPRGNLDPYKRIMLTGEISLQVDKRKVKYRAACSRAFNGSTKEMYSPTFWIEIPDLLK